MNKKKQIALWVLMLGMIGLSGCKTPTISRDFKPSLTPTAIEFPKLPAKYKEAVDGKPIYPELILFEVQFQTVSGMCLIERGVLFNDIKRIQKTEDKFNRKWWQLWK